MSRDRLPVPAGYITLREASTRLGLHRTTVLRRARAGRYGKLLEVEATGPRSKGRQAHIIYLDRERVLDDVDGADEATS